jgi:hypothetical protein
MKKAMIIIGVVLCVGVLYALCFGFGKGIQEEQKSPRETAFVNIQQLIAKHPRMNLVRQIDAELEALSLWREILKNGLFIDISEERYEQDFISMLEGCENLEKTIKALQAEVCVTISVDTYIADRIFEQARVRIEEEKRLLEEIALRSIDEMEQQLQVEFDETIKQLRDKHWLRTFGTRLELNFLNLSDEEKIVLADELYKIEVAFQSEEERLKKEMEQKLEGFTQSAHALMTTEFQRIEEVVYREAHKQYELETRRIHELLSLAENPRDIYIEKTSFTSDPENLQVDVPGFGQFHFTSAYNNHDPIFEWAVQWCEEEIERLLVEKKELEGAIADEIRIIAFRIAGEQNMDLEVITVGGYADQGTDLGGQVLDMINTRYEWYKGES